ncbi:MAG: SDR family oxidoreductase [Bdellovibrionales bacterium]|nr:SDR family oxidoreductase [Bdellovibrionales bacterium]
MSAARRLALITGGTSGIGLGAARALLADYDLALGYASNTDKAQSALGELRAAAPAGSRVEIYAQPLTNHAEAQRLYAQVTADFGRAPLVLVNSAGRILDGLYMDLDFTAHAQIVNEHLLVSMALAHLALKAMYRERFGRIVNLSSISATYAKRGQANYAAAKAGIEGFTRTLALEVAHRGVTVNAIAPGLIATPMTAQILENFKQDPKEIRRRIPAAREGSPQEVGDLIAFLCSAKAGYITGQTVTIDGGRSLGDTSS